jgi:ubiquinone/menaquinone biosynthesis C-methylase UbiE
VGCTSEPNNRSESHDAVTETQVPPSKKDKPGPGSLGTEMVQNMLHPGRVETVRPDLLLERMALKPGIVAADIGSGPGYLTFRIAQAVGATGVVYGIDISPVALNLLRERTADKQRNPHNNVIPVLNRLDNILLPPDILDVGLLCDVHLANSKNLQKIPADMIASIFRSIKPGGRLYVLDLKEMLNSNESETYTTEDTIGHFQNAGFKLTSADTAYTPERVFLSFEKPK